VQTPLAFFWAYIGTRGLGSPQPGLELACPSLSYSGHPQETRTTALPGCRRRDPPYYAPDGDSPISAQLYRAAVSKHRTDVRATIPAVQVRGECSWCLQGVPLIFDNQTYTRNTIINDMIIKMFEKRFGVELGVQLVCVAGGTSPSFLHCATPGDQNFETACSKSLRRRPLRPGKQAGYRDRP
jgi:hypothetical protein